MDKLEEFSLELRQDERLISFDPEAGYQVHLHPKMLNFLLLSYEG